MLCCTAAGYTLRPELSIVSEFMSRGSLFGLIKQRHGAPLEARLQKSIALAGRWATWLTPGGG